MWPLLTAIPRFLWGHKLLTLGLGALGYGATKLAKKPPTEQKIQQTVQSALPQMPVAEPPNPLGDMLTNVFQELSAAIKENADKLTAKDLDTLITGVQSFLGPMLSAYAADTGLRGMVRKATIANLQAGTQQKLLNQRLLMGAQSPNKIAANQIFGQYGQFAAPVIPVPGGGY